MLLAILLSAFHISSTGLSEADCDWIFDPKPGILTAEDRKISEAVYEGIRERFGYWDLYYAGVRLPVVSWNNQLSDRERLNVSLRALAEIYNNPNFYSFLYSSSSFYPFSYDTNYFGWTTSPTFSASYWSNIFPCFGTSSGSDLFYPSRSPSVVPKWNSPLISFFTSYADPRFERYANNDGSFSFRNAYQDLPSYFRAYAPYAKPALEELRSRVRNKKELSYRLDRETLGALALSVAAIDGKLSNCDFVDYSKGRGWKETLTATLSFVDATNEANCFSASLWQNSSGEVEVNAYFDTQAMSGDVEVERTTYDLPYTSEYYDYDYHVLGKYHRSMKTSSGLSAMLSASAPLAIPFGEIFEALCSSYGGNGFMWGSQSERCSRVEMDFEWFLGGYDVSVNFIRPGGAITQGSNFFFSESRVINGARAVDNVVVTAVGTRSAEFEKTDVSSRTFGGNQWERNERERRYRFGGSVSLMREAANYTISTNYYSKLSRMSSTKSVGEFAAVAIPEAQDVVSRTDSVYHSAGGLDDTESWTITESQLLSTLSSMTNFTYRTSPSFKIVAEWNPDQVFNYSFPVSVNGQIVTNKSSIFESKEILVSDVIHYSGYAEMDPPSAWAVAREVKCAGDSFYQGVRFFDYQYLKLRKDED